jgi:hypothetical protein
VASDCWRQALSARRFNTLIVGPPRDIELILTGRRSGFYEREYVWPDLPELTPDLRITLLVREVGALPDAELEVLNDLIERASRGLHVMSTSSSRLWEAVEAGRFPAELYYRLNWILIDAFLESGSPFAIHSPHEEPRQQPHGSALSPARSRRVEDRRRADD